jgi:hypothetical protein
MPDAAAPPLNYYQRMSCRDADMTTLFSPLSALHASRPEPLSAFLDFLSLADGFREAGQTPSTLRIGFSRRLPNAFATPPFRHGISISSVVSSPLIFLFW